MALTSADRGGLRRYWDAGYTDVCLIQIGGDQQEEFLQFAASDLLPALREAAPQV